MLHFTPFWQNLIKKSIVKNTCGFTLLELLITTILVATIGFMASATFLSMMRGSAKTEIVKEVKQNGDYALSIMERMIRGASDITSTCDGSTTNSLTFVNESGETTTFSCQVDDSIAKVASSSATVTGYITSNQVRLGTTCPGTLAFVCTNPATGSKIVTISFTLQQATDTPAKSEQASIDFVTTITLRNY